MTILVSPCGDEFKGMGVLKVTYTIIAGVNGVGKSCLTGVLRAERRDLGAVIDIDKIALHNKCAAVSAGKIALKKINALISEAKPFTQETTLSGKRTKRTIKLAKKKGYVVRLYYIGLNTCDESVKRVKNRVEKGGHNICYEDIERRFKSRFESLINVLPYCDEAVFYDNENGFVEVGEYKNGELITKGSDFPEWLEVLQKGHV
ncbi:MAG: hypothetical protein FWH05_03240 [Oscillospiraceae bacterium]|nr:hypothetical protein [Oscillospiraceae bacterium]